MAPNGDDGTGQLGEDGTPLGREQASGRRGALARHYSAVADDARRPEQEREAALLYSVAESRLDGDTEEDLEEALEAAERARRLFQELGDVAGLAHARRLIAHARRNKLLVPAVAAVALPVDTSAALQGRAEASLVAAGTRAVALPARRDWLDESRGRLRGDAGALLAAAQRHLREQRPAEARRAGEEALPLFRRLGDRASAGSTLRVLVAALDAEEGPEAAEQMAVDELERCRDSENAEGEAAMLLSLTELNCGRGPQKCEEALRAGTEAQEIFQSLGDRAMEASTLLVLMDVYAEQQDAKEALRAASDALIIFRDVRDKEGEAKAQRGLAAAYGLFGRTEDALRWARRSRASAQEAGSRKLEASALSLTARLRAAAEDFGGMLREAEAALEVAEAEGLFREEADALAMVVQACNSCGRQDQAFVAAERALVRFRAAGDKRGQAAAMDLLSQCHLGRQQADKALDLARGALELVREMGDKQWEANVLNTAAAAELGVQRYEEAGKSAQDAISLMQDLGDSEGEALARLHTLVQVHTQNQEWAKALEALEQALRLVRKAEDREGEAYALFITGNVHLSMERPDKAAECTASARRLWGELGDTDMSVQALHQLSQINVSRGECKEAARQAEEALALCRKAEGHKREEVTLLLHLHQVHSAAWEHLAVEGVSPESRACKDLVAKADRAVAAATRAAVELGDKALLAIAKFRLAQSGLLNGRMLEAADLNAEAAELFRGLGDDASEGSCLVARAQVLQLLGNPRKALGLAQTARTLGQSCGDMALEEEAEARIRQLSQELGLEPGGQ